jgi:hypothetical protein
MVVKKWRWPTIKLGHLERLILLKMGEIESRNPSNPLIDMDDLRWEVAKQYKGGREIDNLSEEDSDVAWDLQHKLDPKYKQIFHSFKRALNYRANFYHSLKRLEERGLIRLHKGTMFRGNRPRIAHVTMTSEGGKYLKEKSIS